MLSGYEAELTSKNGALNFGPFSNEIQLEHEQVLWTLCEVDVGPQEAHLSYTSGAYKIFIQVGNFVEYAPLKPM